MSQLNELKRSNGSDGFSIKEFVPVLKAWFLYLRRKWYIVVLLGLTGGGIGFYYAYKQKTQYIATLSFALEEDNAKGGGGISGLASQLGFDFGGSAGGAFSGSNLSELMKSRSLVEKTLLNPITVNGREISLAEYYIQLYDLRKGWENIPGLAGRSFKVNDDRSKFTLQQDSVLGIIEKDITTEKLNVGPKDKKINITYIDVKSADQLFSKVFAVTLAKVVSDFYVQTKSRKSQISVDIMQHQVDSLRAQLNSGIAGVAAASDNVFNLNPSMNIMRAPSARRQIDVQTNTAMLMQLVQNLEVARMSLRKETPLIQIIDEPILPLPRIKPSKLNYLIRGGLLGGFIAVIGLIGFYWYKKTFSSFT
ncbi:lipopolysaccharide biosynthesis protein [Sediminibacterium roseum]|uniref:Lipopolysaccharide biosynthesis protein n=1 Tax=Sediminibacterium roseum TaxID=1978412 RepID=A0ABW9ZSM3_9BACT|nr:lipopolysaccharide biosynthesis protein [Sediminibacterium roseum]NCI49063.1 lipopolysaccharide biosynthesis protein [Sediminibacterium roseum]